MKFLFLSLFLLSAGISTPVDLVVVDASGAGLKNELVIIQDLRDAEHEILRVLSDKEGKIPVLSLQPGLYRAIATAPYGTWQTQVREFLVADKPLRLALEVRPMSTHGYGDIVTVGTKKRQLKVSQADGRPASGAEVHIRDRDATLHLERRYKTNSLGEVEIELVSEPTVVVIVYGNSLTTREISESDAALAIRLPSTPD